MSTSKEHGDTFNLTFEDSSRTIICTGPIFTLKQATALIASRVKKSINESAEGWTTCDSSDANIFKQNHQRLNDRVFVKKGASKYLVFFRLFVKASLPTYSSNYLEGKVIVDVKNNDLFLIGKSSHIKALFAHLSEQTQIPYNEDEEREFYLEEKERSKLHPRHPEYFSWLRILELRANL